MLIKLAHRTKCFFGIHERVEWTKPNRIIRTGVCPSCGKKYRQLDYMDIYTVRDGKLEKK